MTHRAVIVGVNDYSGQASLPPGWSVGNLNRSLDDAEAMNTLLTQSFGANVCASLKDGAATREAILGAINDMLTASEAGDVATFFFSGHGGRLPADGTNPQRYYECFIPASGSPITDLDLHAVADSLQPSSVNFTVILDSCNSGGIHEGTPDNPVKSASYTADVVQACIDSMSAIVPCGALVPPSSGDFDGNVANVVGQGNGVVCSVDDNKALVASSKSCVVAACRYDESAWESDTHSALTQALCDVIAMSGANISYQDLIDKLRDEVQNQLGKSQTPTLLGQQNRMGENFLAGWNTCKPEQFDDSAPSDTTDDAATSAAEFANP